MKTKLYVQYENGGYVNYQTNDLRQGAWFLDMEFIKCSASKMKKIVTRNDIVYGSIGYVEEALKSLQIPIPKPHNPVDCIPSQLKRRVGISNLGVVRSNVLGSIVDSPDFIKPLDTAKLFTGFVVRSQKDLQHIRMYPDETRVIVSEYVEFVSEYRVFVMYKRPVGIKHYKGDPFLFPPWGFDSIIKQAIEEYGDKQPAAYTIDYGFDYSGKWYLIEINDGYGFGAYGLNPTVLLSMCQARFKELCKI